MKSRDVEIWLRYRTLHGESIEVRHKEVMEKMAVIGQPLGFSGLDLPVFVSLDLSFILKSLDKALFSPSGEGGEVTKNAELPVVLQLHDLQRLRHNHPALVVIWVWDSVEYLQAAECSSTSGNLVWQHSSYDSPEDARWSPEMERTLAWVCVVGLVQELLEFQLVAEQRA